MFTLLVRKLMICNFRNVVPTIFSVTDMKVKIKTLCCLAGILTVSFKNLFGLIYLLFDLNL